MSPRSFAILAGAALVVGAFIALLLPVTIDDGGEVSCGNGLASEVDDVKMHDLGREIAQIQVYGGVTEESTLAQQCDDAITTRRTWGWPVAGLGAFVLLGGLLIRVPATRDVPGAAAEGPQGPTGSGHQPS